MNEWCNLCSRYAREDDPMGTAFLQGGMQQACRDCHGDLPRIYPVGLRLPTVGDGMGRRFVRVCGICRQAVRWDAPDSQLIRVKAEDLLPGFPGVEPGAYYCCNDCRAVLRPRILERLIREGEYPEGTTLRQMPMRADC